MNELFVYDGTMSSDSNGIPRRATPAEISEAYANLVRTEPPTKDEVPDGVHCLAFDTCWDMHSGATVRFFWGRVHDVPFTHWLPMPPDPKGGSDE